MEPQCIDGECIIPELDEQGKRIIEIRSRLGTLRSVVDPGTILRLYDADLEDIEMLAWVEEELEELRELMHDEKDQKPEGEVNE